MIEPLRVAVVGLGYWGPNLLRNLVELAKAEVVTMCDEREERLAHWGKRYPAIDRTASYMDVLSDDRVEAVVIATPVSTHFELASRALRFGKHTFVEKPLAGSYEEAEELVNLARRAGRVLMPGHTFLYSPPVVLVKELIDRGDLGEIYFVSSSRVNLGLRHVLVIYPFLAIAAGMGASVLMRHPRAVIRSGTRFLLAALLAAQVFTLWRIHPDELRDQWTAPGLVLSRSHQLRP